MKKSSLAVALTLSISLSAFAGGSHHGGHSHSNGAGKPGEAESVDRTVAITMHDTMRYNLSELEVKAGETVRFTITNKGTIPHEFTLDTQKALLEHRDMMRNMPAMAHNDPNAITLEPGASGEIIWTFNDADTIEIGCLIPGHYEAGMKIPVTTG
ncbi:cupredoxin family protein [Candidatus Sororendozoicomonas aggregata]|uniref:cupredoxin domain-containing protein n=1 Tax=Candidatus Sororendozoicomonas aggregata TaxID=3073239 RepID=UPI002ED5EAF4